MKNLVDDIAGPVLEIFQALSFGANKTFNQTVVAPNFLSIFQARCSTQPFYQDQVSRSTACHPAAGHTVLPPCPTGLHQPLLPTARGPADLSAARPAPPPSPPAAPATAAAGSGAGHRTRNMRRRWKRPPEQRGCLTLETHFCSKQKCSEKVEKM